MRMMTLAGYLLTAFFDARGAGKMEETDKLFAPLRIRINGKLRIILIILLRTVTP